MNPAASHLLSRMPPDTPLNKLFICSNPTCAAIETIKDEIDSFPNAYRRLSSNPAIFDRKPRDGLREILMEL